MKMVLHTIMPLDAVMSLPQQSAPTRLLSVTDGLVEAEQNGDGFCVRRLISTNPRAFLQKKYAPGAAIKPE